MGVSVIDRQAKIDIIEKWKQSGLSQKEFYQQQNIPAHVFYYWHKVYRDQQHNKASSFSESFVQIASSASVGHIEVQFPNGTRIIFNEPVSCDFLKVLIR